MSAAAPQLVQFDYVYTDSQGNSVTGSVILDASVSEQHTIGAEVTRHQVETGSDVTDHIRPLPQKISIEGIVTNTPIASPLSPTGGVSASFGTQSFSVGGVQYTAQTLLFSGQFDRVRDTYGVLIIAVSNGALFTVTTTLHQYQNMAISNFGAPRNVGLGNALKFSVDFSEIRIVDTVVVTAPPSAKKAVTNGGAKPTKVIDDNPPTTKAGSVSYNFEHAILGH